MEHGIFATKSARCLNVLGLLTGKFLIIENYAVHIEMVDIKPFFSKFDNRTNTKSRWLDNQGNIPI